MVVQAGVRTWKFYAGSVCWAVFCVVAALNSFGTVAFTLSLFLTLYTWGFRKKWANDGLSAYSVFNCGQREIAGTFSARNIDQQLRGTYGAAAAYAPDGDVGGAGRADRVAGYAHAQGAYVPDCVSGDEKLRRREAAAAAAERRAEVSRLGAAGS